MDIFETAILLLEERSATGYSDDQMYSLQHVKKARELGARALPEHVAAVRELAATRRTNQSQLDGSFGIDTAGKLTSASTQSQAPKQQMVVIPEWKKKRRLEQKVDQTFDAHAAFNRGKANPAPGYAGQITTKNTLRNSAV